ncbi:MAG: 16S rRNA (cytidine(1402)-2'-O)-methyltransferase [Rhodospirillaceae bacterium]|nr:16S rRNA (cytidine(1402)-2'-O)-methyltransferase [Rhodospirillaceae bacterium]HAA93479.1 16S rRNA (cytidine(1402)-2'-O)-methyltransferase [Rhodospirillaceae bacterium]
MTLAIHDKSAGKQAKTPEGLYVIPTPIGNLRDITLRALDILAEVDLIACEDTRITQRLLNAFELKTPMVPYHDHNAAKQRPRLLKKLAAGETIALVSDAGTPLISDPGYKMVCETIEAGYSVTVLPGASAAITGLLAAGLPTDRFLFAGFPPSRSGGRRKFFAEFESCSASLIFFESPKRLGASLSDMAYAFGDRPASIARELTKKFEEVRRGSLLELAAASADSPAPKGEIVVIVGPPTEAETPTPDEIDKAILAMLDNASLKQTAEEVSAALNLPRRQIYQRALQLRDNGKSS